MNLYDYIHPQVGESFDTLLDHGAIKIVRIVSSDSIDNSLYIQDEDEWVVVIEGRATLEIESQRVILQRGDNLLIPAKVPHRVIDTLPDTLWLAIHIGSDTKDTASSIVASHIASK